jgi:hypothetical protein
MPFHRLTAPTYVGGLPGTHDYINDPAANGDAGGPAPAGGKKSGGANDGTYLVAFGEDATSSNTNRGLAALAANTDYLDDVVNAEVPVIANVDGLAGVSTASLAITGDVFVGKSGTANTQGERNRLIKVLDSTTGNDLVDASGNKVQASLIHNGALTNQVGVPATGFYTNPTVDFSPAIPAGSNYRIVFGIRSSLVDGLQAKTRQDAFTRELIASSHQTSAEMVRWITEAGRRSGGTLAALAATIIETPGIGENILGVANSLTMDIDPDESTAFNGSFNVRWHRDGTAKTLFSVLEGAGAGASIWQNTAERIALADVNTLASGFTATNVPFSSGTAADGDDNIRILGTDPGATSVSVLKRLNAMFTITCGNGTTTFGDFNGSSAIADAVAFALAAGVDDYRILVKDGAYSQANVDLISDTGNHTVVIEGVNLNGGGSSGARVRNNAATGASNACFVISGTGDNKIIFRNLTFTRGSTSNEILYTPDAAVIFENCTAINQTFSPVFAGSHGASISDGRQGPHQVIIRGCQAAHTVDGIAAVHVLATTTAAIDSVLIEDCAFDLSGTENTPAIKLEHTGTGGSLNRLSVNRCRLELGSCTLSGGDPVGNSGMLEYATSAGGTFNIETIEFDDVRAQTNGTATNGHLMLYFRQLSATVEEFIIRNSVLRTGSVQSSLGTFYIGGGTEAETTVRPERVLLESIRWGGVGTMATYGASPTELAVSSDLDWAAYAISCDRVVMRNITWERHAALSDMGDLVLSNIYTFDVDGIYMSASIGTGSGAAPNHRIRVVGAPNVTYFTAGVIRNINWVTTFANEIADNGLLVLKPCLDGDTVDHVLRVQDVTIAGFSYSGSTGIRLESDANNSQNGILFDNCVVRGMGEFGWAVDTNAAAVLRNITLRDCVFAGCATGAFVDNTGATFGEVKFFNCTFKDNTGYGLHIIGGTWAGPGFTCMNCTFDNNDSGGSDYSAYIDSASPEGTMLGNVSPDGLQIFKLVGATTTTAVKGSGTDWSGNVTSASMILNHMLVEVP